MFLLPNIYIVHFFVRRYTVWKNDLQNTSIISIAVLMTSSTLVTAFKKSHPVKFYKKGW